MVREAQPQDGVQLTERRSLSAHQLIGSSLRRAYTSMKLPDVCLTDDEQC
jgi:hypothetical protein